MTKFSVLKKPLLTEKTLRLMERENKYVFEVSKDANKNEIAQVIKDVYGVIPLAINVLRTSSKTKRSWTGDRSSYEKPSIKKAIIHLKAGDKLDIYEGGTK